MAKTAAQRMAAYRARSRASGLTALSLLVPEADVASFRALAQARCEPRDRLVGSRPLIQLWRSPSGLGNALDHQRSAGTEANRRSGAGSRAQSIAEEIVQRVIRLGWPVGHVLGSEAELMKTYAVSRPVLRQAIRLLEHYGVMRIRRGAAGGLVVAAPDEAATIRAVSIHLEYRRVGPMDILQTRRVIEEATTSFAVARLTPAGVHRLNEVIASEASLDGHASADALQRFHRTVADLSGDPALKLFAGIVLQLSDAHSTFSRRPLQDRHRVVKRIRQLHRAMAKAIIERDAEGARRVVGRYLDGYQNWME